MTNQNIIQKNIKKQFQLTFPKKNFKLATYQKYKLKKNYIIKLDNYLLKTPNKNILLLPTKNLAKEICNEWNKLKNFINPNYLPLTKIANSAIEEIILNKSNIIKKIIQFGETDLLFYQKNNPNKLKKQQELYWNPIIKWAENKWNIKYKITYNINYIKQDTTITKKYSNIINKIDNNHKLAALYLLTISCNSLLIALAYDNKKIYIKNINKIVFLDENWNIYQQNQDKESIKNHNFKLSEILSFCNYLDLLKR